MMRLGMERKTLGVLAAVGAAMAVGIVANQLANKLQVLESRLSAVHTSQASLKSGVDNLISEVSRFSYLFPGVSHKDVRIFFIQQQARQAPKGSILLIGDSITEGLFTEQMCGLAVLNAGIGGAGVTTFRKLVTQVSQEIKPSVVVISLGVNDARAQPGMSLPQWKNGAGTIRT